MELQQSKDVGFTTKSHSDRCQTTKLIMRDMVQEIHDIKGAKEPENSRRASAIHDIIRQTLYVLNAALSKVLVLMLGFALGILNAIHALNLLDSIARLHFGMVTEQAHWSTVITD